MLFVRVKRALLFCVRKDILCGEGGVLVLKPGLSLKWYGGIEDETAHTYES
jgi:hypothetical protein